MSTADIFFKQIFNEQFNSLHTAMPCTVIKYYENERKADIRPNSIRKTNNGSFDYPLINKAPVLRHVGRLETGDTVFTVFAERALDGSGNRRHDLTDGVIIGVM